MESGLPARHVVSVVILDIEKRNRRSGGRRGGRTQRNRDADGLTRRNGIEIVRERYGDSRCYNGDRMVARLAARRVGSYCCVASRRRRRQNISGA